MTATEPAFRSKLYKIIFESDTLAGKLFDISLLLLIAGSIVLFAWKVSRNYIQGILIGSLLSRSASQPFSPLNIF